MKGAIGVKDNLGLISRERWRVATQFFSTFLAEPVIGIFSGCYKAGIKTLAEALVDDKKQAKWSKLTGAVERLPLVWPFLFLMADEIDDDGDVGRAIGERLLFGIDSDERMKAAWWENANDAQVEFAEKWAGRDRATYKQWEREVGVVPPTPTVIAVAASRDRAAQHAEEVRSGIIFPSLLPLRPFTFDSGMINFLCPHGILIRWELLEAAESPAGIAEILARYLPVLPKLVYFDTACQSARNATRRILWLLRLSLVMWFLDRFHQPAYVCSGMYNAEMYPTISSLHKTSVVESRHLMNKPLHNQVAYMSQRRFMVHMSLYGALNNMNLIFKHTMQPHESKAAPEVGHRPILHFVHTSVVSHCERRGCGCRGKPRVRGGAALVEAELKWSFRGSEEEGAEGADVPEGAVAGRVENLDARIVGDLESVAAAGGEQGWCGDGGGGRVHYALHVHKK